MSDDSLNPYAPPSQEEAPSDVVGGIWRVEGDYLVVKEGTMLPAVDVDGRGRGGPLTPIAMKLPVPLDGKGLAVNLGAVLPMVGYVLIQAIQGKRPSWLWMVGIWLVVSFLSRGVKVRTAPALVYGYISVPAIRAISRRDRLRNRLAVGLLVPVFVIFPLVALYPRMTGRYDLTLDAAKWGGGMMALSLLILFGVAIWKQADKGWRCPRCRDGWLWIKGLGPEALAGLGARAVGYHPVPVKRKVFKARLDLMPASFWKWAFGPGLWGRLKLWSHRLKTKGRPVEHVSFHWSEREWLSPAEADAEMLDSWHRETASTPLADWALVYVRRMDIASGGERVNELMFLSPDGRHVAIPFLRRVVMDRKFREIRGLTFHSFTTGGRIIITSTGEPMELLPPEIEFGVSKGKPMEVADAHLRRTSGEELLSIGPVELRSQEERAMQLSHETMESAGIFGPTEEMDFYWP